MTKELIAEACVACGASPGADHAEGCTWLYNMQAASWPARLDRNGRVWWLNKIDALAAENRRLAAALEEKEAECKKWKSLANIAKPSGMHETPIQYTQKAPPALRAADTTVSTRKGADRHAKNTHTIRARLDRR